MPHARSTIEAPASANEAPEAALASPGPSALLFVDDDLHVRRSFSRVARRMGFDVDLAGSGDEALRLAQTRAYSVVVTDLRMPEVDGLTLIQRLYPILPNASYVLSTGVVDFNLPSNDLLDRAICSVVEKPWNWPRLEQTLARAVELHDSKCRGGSPPDASGQTIRVLLIEGNAGSVNPTIEVLKNGGVTLVTQAIRLREALEWLYDDSFEVVLTDLSLPDARGLDALTRVQAAAPSAAIIVLSGIADQSLASKALQLGAQDFLVKSHLDGPTLRRSLDFALERKRFEQRLTRLARHDQLTGLPNRLQFLEQLEQQVARAQRRKTRLCVMFLDLDRFKQINDTLGHDVGDSLLLRVGHVLIEAVREYDLVARLGGDEFAIVVDDLVEENTTFEVAHRILHAFKTPIVASGMKLDVSVSIGMALFPDAATSTQGLLRAADAAMYTAKSTGRNRCHLHGSESRGGASPRVALAERLRGSRTCSDFRLHFQPQVDLRTEETVAYEALLRWRYGESLLGPVEFLDFLEESGQICEVGAWVLDQVCQTLRRRCNSGVLRFRISINVSRRQLENGLTERVLETLKRYELPPHAIELEVTEAVLLDEKQEQRTLTDLKSAGLRLALDDFGTGYASLACLERFPGDVLKLDRSVVCRAVDSSEGAALTKGIIDLAHSLGLTVVAEGIETRKQLEVLVRSGCDLAQGFLLGRPSADWDVVR